MLVPFSYNHNRDAANNLINSFSLAWAGDTGIANIFHSFWQSVKQNSDIVKSSLSVDRRVMAGLQNNNLVEIKGTLFLLSKIEKTVPMKATMDVELVVF